MRDEGHGEGAEGGHAMLSEELAAYKEARSTWSSGACWSSAAAVQPGEPLPGSERPAETS